jgi:dihydrofolate reductase
MTITLIACISSNAALGNNNKLLFNIKEDLQRFKRLTKNQIVVMGRKTFDSIIEMNGKPLANRINVVLTRDENYESKHGEQAYTSIDRIINHHKTMGDKDKKVYVIGGSEVYRELLPFADEILITHVNKHIEEADTFYPIYLQDELGFTPIEESEEYYTEKYDAYYKFVRYTKSEDVMEGGVGDSKQT